MHFQRNVEYSINIVKTYTIKKIKIKISMEINTVGKLPFLRENIFYNRIRKSYRQSDGDYLFHLFSILQFNAANRKLLEIM